MKTKEELEEAIKDTITGYKEIIFGPGTPVCMAYLKELRRQQDINQKVYDQNLIDETLRKKNMIDRRTGQVLDSVVNSRYWKDTL